MPTTATKTIRKNYIVFVKANSWMWRDRTAEDYEAWLASDASKGMTDSGETKLDSPSRFMKADGRTYKVVRARCTVRYGWRTEGKCAQIVGTDGVLWFVRRTDLAVVGEK